MIEEAARELMEFLKKHNSEGTISIESEHLDVLAQLRSLLQALESALTPNSQMNPKDVQKDAQEILFATDDHIRKFLTRIEGKLPTPEEYANHSYLLTVRADDPKVQHVQYLIWKNKYVQQTQTIIEPTGFSVRSNDVPEESWPQFLKQFIEHRRQEAGSDQ